jgi:hypothetical protein
MFSSQKWVELFALVVALTSAFAVALTLCLRRSTPRRNGP